MTTNSNSSHLLRPEPPLAYTADLTPAWLLSKPLAVACIISTLLWRALGVARTVTRVVVDLRGVLRVAGVVFMAIARLWRGVWWIAGCVVGIVSSLLWGVHRVAGVVAGVVSSLVRGVQRIAEATVGVATSLVRRLLRVGRAVARAVTTLLGLVRQGAPVIRCITLVAVAVAAAARGGVIVHRCRVAWGGGGRCRTAVA